MQPECQPAFAGLCCRCCFCWPPGAFRHRFCSFTPPMGVFSKPVPCILKIVAFAYLPMALSTILSAWLRCKEHAAVPFWAKPWRGGCQHRAELPADIRQARVCPMGVQGAAIATLVSQLLNSLLILLGFAVCLRRDGSHPQWALHFERITLWAYGA